MILNSSSKYFIMLTMTKAKQTLHFSGVRNIWAINRSNTGLPGGASGKEPACQCRRHRRCQFHPWLGKIPWRRMWQSTPVFLPRESHGHRGAWRAKVHGVTKSRIWQKWLSTNTHQKEKESAMLTAGRKPFQEKKQHIQSPQCGRELGMFQKQRRLVWLQGEWHEQN